MHGFLICGSIYGAVDWKVGGGRVGISVELCRRDTFPAMALVIAYLVDEMKVGPEESVVVCPVDLYV